MESFFPLKHIFFQVDVLTQRAHVRRLMTWDLPAPLISSTFRHLPYSTPSSNPVGDSKVGCMDNMSRLAVHLHNGNPCPRTPCSLNSYRMDVHNRSNVGYAFINFLRPDDAEPSAKTIRGFKMKHNKSCWVLRYFYHHTFCS